MKQIWFIMFNVLLVLLLTKTVSSFNFTWNGFNVSKITNVSQNISPSLNLYEGETGYYTFNCNLEIFKQHQISSVTFLTSNPLITSILGDNNQTVSIVTRSCENGRADVALHGGHLGITKLVVEIKGKKSFTVKDLTLNTLRRITLFDELSLFILGPLILINKCAFGAKIEVEVLKRVVTQPVELMLCLLTQFILMPITAILFEHMFHLEKVMALALLVSAACPGGGGGYVFSYLINGDITLAITASLVSTLVAMVAMPGVIGLYSSLTHIPNNIVIPYLKIVLMLFAIATPISTGMLLRRKRPKWAALLVKIIKPLSLFLIFAGLVVVLVTSRYIMYGPHIGYLLALAIPISGFLQGVLLSKIACRDWPLTKAVALESGLKNTVLGVAVIELSFPQPQADLASILIIMITVGQVAVAMMWYFVFLLKKLMFEGKNPEDGDIELDPLESTSFLQNS